MVNVLVAFFLLYAVVFMPFSSLTLAKSNLKNIDSNSCREQIDEKSLDDLFGADPYLFDLANHISIDSIL